MALRDKLRERVQPLLEAGEQVESVFLAQTGPNPNLAFLTWLIFFRIKNDVIAATDRRIAVFSAPRFLPTKPRDLIASYPRDVKVSDESKGLWHAVEIEGTRYWVHSRFRDDLRRAVTNGSS